MAWAGRAQLIGSNQTGGKKDTSVVEASIINGLILKSHRINREGVCVHENDTMGCYDGIIRNHAILNSRKFGMDDNEYKLYCNVHNSMQFKTQIKYFISNNVYQSSQELPLHRIWQGIGNSGTYWTFISVPMIDFVVWVFVIKWIFDHHALPYIEDKKLIISFADTEYSLEKSKQLKPNDPTTYLGVTS